MMNDVEMPVVEKADAIVVEVALYEAHKRIDNKLTSGLNVRVHVKDVKLIRHFFNHSLFKNVFSTEHDFLLECF